MSLESVVIAGAGHAGFQAAAALRQEGFQGRITLIGEEAGLPYQRPPLSKAYMTGKIDNAALSFRPERFFADQRIEIVNARVTEVDRKRQRVELDSTSPIAFDHLVLALGSRNRMLPAMNAGIDGVFGLKTLADAAALRRHLGQARHVVVIGAGFIGLEFAAVARAAGATVSVVDIADRPMSRAVTVEMSRIFTKAHERRGVRFFLDEGLVRLHGRGGKVASVETSSGRLLQADLVVYGTGVIPNIELAAEAGLVTGDGIEVDADLVTSDANISAIGDCSSFPSPRTGNRIRLESVQNATDQARTLAARLVGRRAPYAAVPWFWTEQGDLKLQMAGLASGYDAVVTLGCPEDYSCSVLCFRHGDLIAVESLNRPADHAAARKLLAGGPALAPEVAAMPGFDLRGWLMSAT